MSQVTSHVIDQSFMRRAIALAELGQFTTTPNPNVGCVIVDQHSRIVGEGFHQQAGTPHAEVHALRQAGDSAKGSTVYVTLEPCSHFGRTGPCADALVRAGVARVVVAMQDPNPAVSGNGIARLRENGVRVDIGILESNARALNDGFLSRMETGKPWVTVKLASSIDGRTALANGQSKWITGEAARYDVHVQRAKACAILSGADTVLADDPQLNVRLEQAEVYDEALQHIPLRQPARVIIDGKNRLSPEVGLFQQGEPCIVANITPNARLVESTPVEPIQWQIPKHNGYVCLSTLMSRLAEQQYNRIWVEAGPQLCGALMAANLVDELIIYQSMKLMGDTARPLLRLPEMTDMTAVKEWQLHAVDPIENDIRIVLRP